MIPVLLAARDFAENWWKAALGAAAVFPLAFLLGQCSGQHIGAQDAETDQLRSEVTATKTDAASKLTAAEERSASSNRIDAEHKERTDATKDLPDATPGDLRRARFCEQLRQQHVPAGELPPYCRPKG